MNATTIDVAELTATYDARIDGARAQSAAHSARAVDARGSYDLAVGQLADREVLDDLRMARLQAAIAAASSEYALDALLDERSDVLGRPR